MWLVVLGVLIYFCLCFAQEFLWGHIYLIIEHSAKRLIEKIVDGMIDRIIISCSLCQHAFKVGDEVGCAAQRARQRCRMKATGQFDVHWESCGDRSGSNSPTNLALLLHPASRGAGQREAGRGQRRVQSQIQTRT